MRYFKRPAVSDRGKRARPDKNANGFFVPLVFEPLPVSDPLEARGAAGPVDEPRGRGVRNL